MPEETANNDSPHEDSQRNPAPREEAVSVPVSQDEAEQPAPTRPQADQARALAQPVRPVGAYAWWLVLALVGLDYFSTLAYLPSVAVEAAGANRALVPLIGLGVGLVTLLAALPVYLYVVGRSPHGEGATGLLERLVKGWFGKTLLLVVLGFAATDFVITRTLSVADASIHITHNPLWRSHVQWMTEHKEEVRGSFPEALRGGFFDFWNEQLVLTVGLSILAFGFYAYILLGYTRRFLQWAALVVGVYLALTLLVIISGLVFLVSHGMFTDWKLAIHPQFESMEMGRLLGPLLLLALLAFPQMAVGLSGFELSMTTAPLVEGDPRDAPVHPAGRIRNTRKMLIAVAVLMSLFVLGALTVVALLVPEGALDAKGPATYRPLSWLAHGGSLRGQGLDATINPFFGPWFGTLYDLSTVLILGLAGASATLGIRDLVPRYLARYGMQMEWARRVGVILHLFNVVILIVTIIFQASVAAQLWAYATSVLVLLAAAAVAALLDVRQRWHGRRLSGLVQTPLFLISGFFISMAVLVVWQNASGLAIALVFIVTVLGTAFVSRWLRSTELRFGGFTFADSYSRERWEVIRQLEFQVLVPHDPAVMLLPDREAQVRKKHRLGPDVRLIFVQVEVGDPSNFYQEPLMQIFLDGDREIIHLSRCASIPHALASVCLEFNKVGSPPEMYFDWSEGSPLVATLRFLFMGQGNLPTMVHELVRSAEPDVTRRPRVVVG